MPYLDEIAALIEGSSSPNWFASISTGGNWTGVSSSDTGWRFQTATSDSGVIVGFTTSTADAVTANVIGDVIRDFGRIAGPDTLWPVYRGHMPDSSVISDRAVALVETAGEGEPGRVDIDKRGLQVLIRGASVVSVSTSYEEGEALAIAVRDALHEHVGAAAGTHYVGIWAESGPFALGFDAAWRPQFSANFRAWRDRSAT